MKFYIIYKIIKKNRNLYNNNLNKSIPESIGNLTNLEEL